LTGYRHPDTVAHMNPTTATVEADTDEFVVCETCDRTVREDEARYHSEVGVHECLPCEDERENEMMRACHAANPWPSDDEMRRDERDTLDAMA
jgi:hypothetical protein